jgi:hypothetical protein
MVGPNARGGLEHRDHIGLDINACDPKGDDQTKHRNHGPNSNSPNYRAGLFAICFHVRTGFFAVCFHVRNSANQGVYLAGH